MVMYRDFAQRKARLFGIIGTVQNKEDGSVEIYAQGEEEALSQYIKALHSGPVLSRVDNVTITAQDTLQIYNGFSIVY